MIGVFSDGKDSYLMFNKFEPVYICHNYIVNEGIKDIESSCCTKLKPFLNCRILRTMSNQRHFYSTSKLSTRHKLQKAEISSYLALWTSLVL